MTPILSGTLLRTQSDARLVALVRDGHERAFEAIVERYRRPLHRHVRRLLPESRAEDAVQQALINAWSSLQDGAAVRDLRPWLYRIAQNTALDALKRAGYDYDELTESLRSTHGPEADVERRTVIRETLAGVAALPDNQREALLRTAVAGESRAQIAHDLGVTDGAVRQLVHRARATLRAAATAITPTPVALWAAGEASSAAPSAARLAELGAAGGAGLLLKGGAALVAAGVLVTGPIAVRDLTKHGRIGADSAAADTPGQSSMAARWVSADRLEGSGAGPGAAYGPNSGATTVGRPGGDGHQPASSRHGRGDSGSSGSDSSESGNSGSDDHSGSGHGGRDGSSGGDERSGSSGPSHSGSGGGDGGGDRSGSGSESGSGSVSPDRHGGDGSGGKPEAPTGGGSDTTPSTSGSGSATTPTSGRSGQGDGSPELPAPPELPH
jgi:RNA polymerase sigma factor (sigma-70 family)